MRSRVKKGDHAFTTTEVISSPSAVSIDHTTLDDFIFYDDEQEEYESELEKNYRPPSKLEKAIQQSGFNNWCNLTLTFLPNKRVSVNLPNVSPIVVSYSELGIWNPKTNNLTRPGYLLLAASSQRSLPDNWPESGTKKAASRLRRTLKQIFGLDSNPIIYHQKTRTITARLTVINKMMLDDQRAKEKAHGVYGSSLHDDFDVKGDQRSYNEWEKDRLNEDNAEKWLKENDPE